jgi:glycosidase
MRAINHVNDNTNKITGMSAQINRAKVAAAMTILNPGVSWIYYGDELGMSSNTDKHEELYKYDNNIDLWYRQPYKWLDEEVTPSYTFNSYKIEWDSYNKTIESLEEQKEKANDNDIYDVYKKLIEIKSLYGKNAKYRGYSSGNNNVMHFVVETDTSNFGVFIHSGQNGGTYAVDTSNCKNY